MTAGDWTPSCVGQVDKGVEDTLRKAIVHERIKVSRLERKPKIMAPLLANLRLTTGNLREQVKRKTAQLAAVKEKKGSAALMDEEGVGSGMDCAGTGCRGGSRVASRQYGVGLSQDERHGVVMEEIKEHAKPNGQFGEGTARMFQHILQAGNSLNQVGPMVQTWILHRTGVSMKNELKISFARKTAEVLSLGITKLDSDELKAAIMRAPYLCIAADESLRNGDKKYPIFVSFWDVAAEAVWWGPVRVCVMKDKTAETQAQLFYETIVDVLKYPPKRVLYVLSDNTTSVSDEVGGCVALLQRKQKGEDTRKKNGENPGEWKKWSSGSWAGRNSTGEVRRSSAWRAGRGFTRRA
eukprot:jgi/Undpi1/7727/HiC_scaffold_23.g10200.m1